jgi:hypothetical protein
MEFSMEEKHKNPLSGVEVHIIGSYGEVGTLFALFVPKIVGMHTFFYRSYIGCQY